MEVVVGKLAGFCAGVAFAVNKTEELVKNGKIYCLGELVHNRQVVEKFENRGMKTVSDIEDIPNNSNIIFRAHGEPKNRYSKTKEKNLNLIDLTCKNVILIHEKVEKKKEDSYIIIIGVKGHPETLGTKGFSGENSYILEDEEDIVECIREYNKTDLKKIYIVAHTTFSSKKFDELVEQIKLRFVNAEIEIDKTICNATELRQKEAYDMSKDLNNMIIIGGKHSSNTKKLAEISKVNCKNVHHIETVEDLKNIDFSSIDKIGVMAGASTPKNIIQEVVDYLRGV